MFLDPGAGRKHIESCCAMHPATALIGSPRAHWLRLISPALRRIPIKFSTGKPVFRARPLLDSLPCLLTAHDDLEREWRSASIGTMNVRKERRASPQRAADVSSAEPSVFCRQDAGSTLRFTESGHLFERDHIEPCDSGTPALIRFTSGSTGQPKGAVRTHGFLLEQQRVLEKSLRLVAGEVDLATLPIFVLANLASGVTSVIPQADLRAPGAIEPGPVVQQIKALGPQRVSASPAFLERLADYCSQTSQQLTNFQAVFAGGAPVFPHLLDKFHDMSPAADIAAVYGSTEAEPIAQVRRDEISDADRAAMYNGRGLLAGRPDPAIQVRILGERTRERISGVSAANFDVACQRSNKRGEIIVSGPHVQPGYLHGIGDSEAKLRINGTTWHQTGDAGYLDALGRVWLLGRSCARIRDERGTLYPFQVECAAYRDREVRRAALVEHQGERVLVVQPRNGANLSNLKASLAWADIGRVKLVRRIPLDKRHNAKIDYVALRRIL